MCIRDSCGHWKDGEGLGQMNVHMAKQLGDSVLHHSLPFIAGGDHNLEPHVFKEGFAPYKMNAQLAIPSPAVTCVSATPGRCYDYFLVAGASLPCIGTAKTDLNSDLYPHRP
eukprot:3334719-Pyramimonas_sp.AAC.1